MTDNGDQPDPFEAPPDMVLHFLYEKAQQDRTLAAQIEAAQWRAAAIMERTQHAEATTISGDSEGGSG